MGDEEEEEEENEDDEDGEKKKAKFNPMEYDWTISDGKPKNLAQVFKKMKNLEKEEMEIHADKLEVLDQKIGYIIMGLNDGVEDCCKMIEGKLVVPKNEEE